MNPIDLIMTVVTVLFAYSLVPQVVKSIHDRCVMISWQTLWITSLGMWVTAGCNYALHLWFNTAACSLTASMWTTLLLLRLRWRENTYVQYSGR